MEVQLAACVRESLDSFLYQNAAFMCERLYAEYHTEVRVLANSNRNKVRNIIETSEMP